MSVRCGNCKQTHPTVADVRACHEHAQGKARTLVDPDSFTHIQQRDPVTGEAIGQPIPLKPAQPEQTEPWWYGNGGKPLPFPAGKYAILTPGYGVEGKLHFFVISTPTEGRWNGYVFVKEQAGPDEYPVKGKRGVQVIEWIAEDPKEAMLQYGREIGKCGHCGRRLTDTESRAYGIGPKCRKKMGW